MDVSFSFSTKYVRVTNVVTKIPHFSHAHFLFFESVYLNTHINIHCREPADPALITIPPIEQYGADYTFATPKYTYGEYKNFFMFIVKESEKSGLKADGNTFPSNTKYTKIPNTDYVGGHVVVWEFYF